ncbi:MAG TPA: hypothetical protein VE975_06550 [Actinomycetota bacterium]|nr:hypothetical protein [Actinomycetota bacterium]
MSGERPSEEHVRQRARELLHGGEDASEAVEGDADAARDVARVTLQESEERIFDPSARDPQRDDVIRRSSEESASDPEAG